MKEENLLFILALFGLLPLALLTLEALIKLILTLLK